MGFFDDESAAVESISEITDIAGVVPHDEEAQGFFAENQEEAVVEEPQEVSEDTTLPEEAPQESTNVPISELLVERRKRQEMEQELGEQRHTLQLMNERIQHAQQMQQIQEADRQRALRAQQQPAEEIPDEEEDPLGYANWKVSKLEGQVKNIAGHLAQQRRTDAAEKQQRAANGAVEGVVQQSQILQNQFAGATPDYWEALEFLTEARGSELQAMGYEGRDLEQAIANERGLIVNSAINRLQDGTMDGWKHNPAEAAYNLARMRGFVTKEERSRRMAEITQEREQAARPRNPVQVSNRDKSNMINSGQYVGTMAAQGATPNQGAIGLEQIAEMSDGEFERFSNEHPGVVEAMLGN